ncbi:MAG TPA: hypothetical protein VHS78_19365 [Candidatus Elarobacter sp.]|jgi:hypothetical protein|nr:hypothetical protein [Candidatus Elarobacter sp.]
MSTTRFAFAATLLIGGEKVPIASEIVTGDAESQDGVKNGFLFQLALQPGDTPPVVNLGDVIAFVENKLGAGAGSLASNPGLTAISQAIPGVSSSTFNSGNDGTLIVIKSFEVNSTAEKSLFAISIDLEGSDPTTGLIGLPPELASWLRIDNLAISFTATGTQGA